MLTQTTEKAIQVMIALALRNGADPIPPNRLAEMIGGSPSYLAKITGLLVKADLLTSTRGTRGGVSLAREPEQITLLEIVEACQGRILGDYCGGIASSPDLTCAFHQSMLDLHQALVAVLMRWTVADLAAKPMPSESLRGKVPCRMKCFETFGSVD